MSNSIYQYGKKDQALFKDFKKSYKSDKGKNYNPNLLKKIDKRLQEGGKKSMKYRRKKRTRRNYNRKKTGYLYWRKLRMLKNREQYHKREAAHYHKQVIRMKNYGGH